MSGIILSGSETATGGALMVSLASSLLAFFRSPVRSVRRMVPSLTSPMCREEKAFDGDRHDDDAVRRAAQTRCSASYSQKSGNTNSRAQAPARAPAAGLTPPRVHVVYVAGAGRAVVVESG